MPSLPHTAQLLAIMARLRNPQGGCPWDLEQDFASIAPYTIEEAYEVADAIARGDMDDLQGELGDLLLQVVFHAQMAAEQGLFDFEAVARGIAEKMIRRHPHVFSDAEITSAAAQTENWEQIKQAERHAKKHARVLDDVPSNLPALMRAQKLQKRAARVGFDWPDIGGVLAKLREELAEVEEAIGLCHPERSEGSTSSIEMLRDAQHDKIKEEMGDLLFSVVNLARFLDVDAEEALRTANQKFTRRFGVVEDGVQTSGKGWDATTLEEMEAYWHDAKKAESLS